MAMNDGYSCDSYRSAQSGSRVEAVRPTRRGFLLGLGLGSLAWAMPQSALSQLSVNPGHEGGVVVSIFLRGGMDGLNVVVPFGEDAYHRSRPAIGLKKEGVIDLDGFFALNRQLAALEPFYRSGEIAIIQAVGSFDQTRSHFEAMNTMERGLAGGVAGASSGWIARYLAETEPKKPSPLRGVAFGGTMPDSLRGSNAITLNDLREFRIDTAESASFASSLRELYGSGKDAMAQAGIETLGVLDTMNRLDPATYKPMNGVSYPTSDLGRALQQVALLIRAQVGLEVAVLDKGGWDTHVAQGGLLPMLLEDLSASLTAFARDLGHEMRRVTVVVQTEFGRRVAENSGAGTDHGRASCMFVLGGNVRGGKVYGDWPGLEPVQLEGPGDLRVTTDYRSVLSQVLASRTSCDPDRVFKGVGRAAFSLFA